MEITGVLFSGMVQSAVQHINNIIGYSASASECIAE